MVLHIVFNEKIVESHFCVDVEQSTCEIPVENKIFGKLNFLYKYTFWMERELLTAISIWFEILEVNNGTTLEIALLHYVQYLDNDIRNPNSSYVKHFMLEISIVMYDIIFY